MLIKNAFLILGASTLLGFANSSPKYNITAVDEKPENMSKTFFYFAYGSNMLAKRIHINSPSAVQKYIGKIKDHRLDFNLYSKFWKGAASTIVPTDGSDVWGVVWEISLENLPHLDDQEGVKDHIYFPKNVTVHTSEGEKIECRVYQQCHSPDRVPPKLLPPERQPSYSYLSVMIHGAKSFNIPEYYIEVLKSFPNNGNGNEMEIPGVIQARMV